MSNLPKCDELSERSKDDLGMIVGSEIRGAIQEARARIAELEARNEVQRVHLEEQIERIADLEAERVAMNTDYGALIGRSEYQFGRAEQAEAERDALRDGLDDLRREVLAQLPTYSPTSTSFSQSTKKLINKVFARWQPREEGE